MKPIKEFYYLDFEKDSNILITFLSTYGQFNKLTVKKIDDKTTKNDKYIIIEREFLNIPKIKVNFPNIEIIDNKSIIMGRFKLILT
jgi:hypothetical protein